METYNRKKIRLGDLLINQGVITSEQLMQAIEKQKETKERLGVVLTVMGFATEMEIAKALQRQFGYQMVQLSSMRIGEDVLSLVKDAALLKKYVMIPFEFLPGNAGIYVAMEDPMNLMAVDDLSIVTNMRIKPVIATTSDILTAIDKYYGNQEVKAVAEAYSKEREKLYKTEKNDNRDEDVSNAPIVMLIKTMVEQAVRQRASDIHIEPLEDKIRVRNRVDGTLIEVGNYPINMLQAMIARVKIIGGMDIAEKRKPQDGRITQIVDRIEYDIRVSTLPTIYGEKVVMRIASKNMLTKKKEHLGLSEEDMKKLDRILENPYGMLLVTGPTGSGKSTTLYTLLSELNKIDVNIVTVEDPVEANIDGINQIQVNAKADLTFVSALRSILRQDPDIIMIGEIRDMETASIAATASITGHLVVSTLHTNNAAGTIMRLIDMGIEPYLIADSTIGVIAQRLVKRLCTCKKERLASDVEKKFLGIESQEPIRIYEAAGCNKCNDTGYLGRIGVYEIMPVTNIIHDVIARNCSAREIQRAALSEGMSTLKMSAAKLVLQGITTLEEMKKVSYSDETSELKEDKELEKHDSAIYDK